MMRCECGAASMKWDFHSDWCPCHPDNKYSMEDLFFGIVEKNQDGKFEGRPAALTDLTPNELGQVSVVLKLAKSINIELAALPTPPSFEITKDLFKEKMKRRIPTDWDAVVYTENVCNGNLFNFPKRGFSVLVSLNNGTDDDTRALAIYPIQLDEALWRPFVPKASSGRVP